MNEIEQMLNEDEGEDDDEEGEEDQETPEDAHEKFWCVSACVCARAFVRVCVRLSAPARRRRKRRRRRDRRILCNRHRSLNFRSQYEDSRMARTRDVAAGRSAEEFERRLLDSLFGSGRS